MMVFLILLIFLSFPSCSPIKSTSPEGKYRMEISMQEIQTNVDDLRRDLNCFQTEIQILNTKLKQQEKILGYVKEHQIFTKIAFLEEQIKNLETKISKEVLDDIKQLFSYAEEIRMVLSQYKEKLVAVEHSSNYQKKIQEKKIDDSSIIK